MKDDGAVEPCCFNGRTPGEAANALTADRRCVWCSAEEMRRRLGDSRLEKLLIYSLVNFNTEVRIAALARLPAEAQHIREAVDAQLAEDDEEEAMAAEAAAEAADAPAAEPAEDAEEPEDDGEDSGADVDSNVADAAEEDAPLEVAEADVVEWREVHHTSDRPESKPEENVDDGASAAVDEADAAACSSTDEDQEVAAAVAAVSTTEHHVLPLDLEDDYASLFGDFRSDESEQSPAERVAAAVTPAELMESTSEVSIAVAEAEEAADVVPKRRRLRHKQPATGPWAAAASPADVVESTATPAKRRRLCGKQPPTRACLAMQMPSAERGGGRKGDWVRRCQQCPGKDPSNPCVFSTVRAGEASMISRHRGQTHCLFCSDDHLNLLLGQQRGAQVTKSLAALQQLSEEQFELGIANLSKRRGKEFAEDFRSRVMRSTKRAEARAVPKLSTQQQWCAALTARVRIAGGTKCFGKAHF